MVAMVVNSLDQDEIWGAVRNSVLTKTFLPEWALRVFVPSSSNSSLARRMVTKLQASNASVYYYASDKLAGSVPRQTWSYLIADDPRVEYFLIRNPKQRLSARDTVGVNQWISSDAAVYCVRDQPSHQDFPMVDGLWGARSHRLRSLLGTSMRSLLLDYFRNSTGHPNPTAEGFLLHVLWILVRNDAFCQGSVSCDKWPNSVPLPTKTDPSQSLGLLYDHNEIIIYVLIVPQNEHKTVSF